MRRCGYKCGENTSSRKERKKEEGHAEARHVRAQGPFFPYSPHFCALCFLCVLCVRPNLQPSQTVDPNASEYAPPLRPYSQAQSRGRTQRELPRPDQAAL